MKKKSKKTKILAVADIHGDTGLVKRLAKQAEEEDVDLVILAGDLTFAESSVKNLIGPFVKAKKQVLLIPGNHESMATVDFLAQMYPGTRNISGYYFRKGDLGIFGAGGGDVVMVTPDKEIFYLLKKSHEHVKNAKHKIMVTHMHPRGSKSEFSGWPGSKAVRKAIKEFHPDVLINGHIHEAGGIEEKIGKTKVINVSRKAKVFEV
jgi:Icc-related predicted phosphoesterase